MIQHLVEAALYVDDLDRAEAFYRDVLGLELVGKEPGRHVFFRAGDGVLLVFDPEATGKGGLFPSHGARGPSHAALGISADSLDYWREPFAGARRPDREGSDMAQGRSVALFPRSGRQLRRTRYSGLLGIAIRLVRFVHD